jgi:uncharacterized protein with PIN domain
VTVVLDASAILTFLQGEEGADVVEDHLPQVAALTADAVWGEEEPVRQIRGNP